METVFAYILKVNALLVLFYLVYQLALSRETFYKYSRWFLLSGLFVSLVLPFVTFTKIEYYEVKNSIDNQFFQAVTATNEIVQEPILTNQEILFLIYGMICFGFLIKTLFDFFKLFKIIKVSNSEKRDSLVYINTNLVHTPFSFFNYIVFNSELINPVELQNIIKHEEAHSKQKHSFDTLLAQFFIILFWFNPIVWLYRKSMVQNLEFLADSYAIQQVYDRTVYQKTMLKITTQSSNISIINTFNQSSIKKRIIMLNTNKSNRKNIWKMALILPIIAGFIYLFQVEVIAQEKKSVKFKSTYQDKNIAVVDSAVAIGIGYVTNKFSTDDEMKNDAASLKKDHNVDYKFSNIKRNEKDEIIAIKISFNDNKGNNGEHEVIGDEPIKPIHFTVDTDKNGKGQIGFFEHKMKEGKNISNFKVAFITKKDNDTELISRLSILEDENVKVKFSNIKRNNKKEIIAIKIIAKNSDNKEVKYEQITDDGIEDVFIMKEIGGKNQLKIKNSKKDNSAVSETKSNKEIKNKLSEAKTSIKSNEVKVSTSQTDVAPEPQNGLQEFRKQIAMKFKLPEVKSDINASIVVKFLVLKTGEISTITILKEDPKNLGLGDELTRILKESPNWKPGTKDGKPADLYFVLPVAIQIQSTK
jgi:Zn-dependent protease with chaperone function